MSKTEKYLNVLFMFMVAIVCMGIAFTKGAIEAEAQGYLIGTSIFGFIAGYDILKDIK